MRNCVIVLLIMVFVAPVFAHQTSVGYSGAPNRCTCASSCHSSAGGTVTITGFPSNYFPGQTYTLTVRHSAGLAIANFNASVHRGIFTDTAGYLEAGVNTSLYNVWGETNGIHFTTAQQDSGTFSWTAPLPGTGTVRLYAGAVQGTVSYLSRNSTIVLVSNETPTPPPLPSGLVILPNPPHMQLTWNRSRRASEYRVYRDVNFDFTPQTSNLIAVISDTAYVDSNAVNDVNETHYYVVTAATP
jgi:hypothetical protein